MKVEQAITTAIEYENRVRDTYVEAARTATNEKARTVFQTLADEEQGHVDYLEHCLATWKKGGVLDARGLTTSIPRPEVIREGVERLKQKLGAEPAEGPEVEMLQRALAVEVETSNFYKEMVSVLAPEHTPLFARFLEIEEGHQAIVQAEIDTVTGLGFWFDVQEFDLEAG